MSMEVSLVDQQVHGLVRTYSDRLAQGKRAITEAFTVLCLRTYLQLDDDEALECITEGGNDASIDAVHIHVVDDAEIQVTLVQSKYSELHNAGGEFPFTEIVKMSSYIDSIFVREIDMNVNARLRARLAEIKAFVDGGSIVKFQILCCNNGKPWNKTAQKLIDQKWTGRVVWQHVNHQYLISVLESQKSAISGSISFSGKVIVENHDFIQIAIGKVSVSQIRDLFDSHGDALLQRNVRRHLGLNNRVNSEIRDTLVQPDSRRRFYFYNNGVTATCERFTQQDMREDSPTVRFSDLQIINGGQSCKTIQQTLASQPGEDFSDTYVLFRLYAVGAADSADELTSNITKATNSQSAVELGDLRANDKQQKRLQMSLRHLGYTYRAKRGGRQQSGQNVISSYVAAESVLAIWRCKPTAAKFRRNRLFSTEIYNEIFSDTLNGAQAATAVLVYRSVESERRKHNNIDDGAMRFIPYATHFIAMIMGWMVLKNLNLELEDLNHKTFDDVKGYLEANRDSLYNQALAELQTALNGISISDNIPLPRLAAVFRRGDLLSQISTAMGLPGPATGTGGSPSVDKDENIIVDVRRSGVLAVLEPEEKIISVTPLGKGDFTVAHVGLSRGESVILFFADGRALTVKGTDLPQVGGFHRIPDAGGGVVGAVSTDPRFMPEFIESEEPDLGDEFEAPYPHMVAVSRSGKICRFTLWRYRKSSKRPRRYMTLADGDAVVRVIQVYAEDELCIFSLNKRVIRFGVMEIPLYKRASKGVAGITFSRTDRVAGAWLFGEDSEVALIVGKKVVKRGAVGSKIAASNRGGRGRVLAIRNKQIRRVEYPVEWPDFGSGEARLVELGYAWPPGSSPES